jgi:UDP-2-acetamido-3-amino-2,3-dideoxy-glucuronate N-acetyltransferase
MSNLRIGVIGTGYWGKNLLRNFNDIGVLAAICDTQPDVVESYVGMYPDAACFTDVAKMLESDAVDAVAIAAPAILHYDLALMALRAGKHVFVEKPLCLDVAETDEIIELAAHHDLRLMVGHLLLYHPAFVALAGMVVAGGIGKLRYIYSNRLSLGKIRREENALWSFAPHDISMILQLAQRMPREIVATGAAHFGEAVADTTISHLKFDDDLQAHIFVSWLHPYKDHRLVVIGDSGMIVFNDVEPGDAKLLHYPHIAEIVDDVPFVNKAEAVPIPYDKVEPLAQECRHFVDAVDHGTTPRSDGVEGARVLKVLDACQRSLDGGGIITLNDQEQLK